MIASFFITSIFALGLILLLMFVVLRLYKRETSWLIKGLLQLLSELATAFINPFIEKIRRNLITLVSAPSRVSLSQIQGLTAGNQAFALIV